MVLFLPRCQILHSSGHADWVWLILLDIVQTHLTTLQRLQSGFNKKRIVVSFLQVNFNNSWVWVWAFETKRGISFACCNENPKHAVCCGHLSEPNPSDTPHAGMTIWKPIITFLIELKHFWKKKVDQSIWRQSQTPHHERSVIILHLCLSVFILCSDLDLCVL